MSIRNQQNQRRKPGVSSVNKPDGFSRRTSHKRFRRKNQMLLKKLDLDGDFVLPQRKKSSLEADPADKPQPVAQNNRFKVWKTKSWKRRSALRSRKASAYRKIDESKFLFD